MNQNEIDLLFGRICSASEKLHYLRNKLYQFIKVTDDGELTQLTVPLTVVPQHSQVDISNVRIIVTHAYKSQAELLNLVHDDFQVNANLVPLECLVSISDDLKLELQKIKENIYDVAKSLLEKQTETVYFDLTNDSSECLRTNGTYFKVFNLTLINDTLILGGAVENDTPEVCPADDVFIEDFCGLLMAHCSDLKP